MICVNNEDFLEWLETMPGHDIVGTPRHAACCPIATYAKSYLCDAEDVWVLKDTLVVQVDGVRINTPLPTWAREYIAYIDRGCEGNVRADFAITAYNRVMALCGRVEYEAYRSVMATYKSIVMDGNPKGVV